MPSKKFALLVTGHENFPLDTQSLLTTGEPLFYTAKRLGWILVADMDKTGLGS
jgi:hypothetical protein